MRHGSLFSGIGAADLAADWMGWENVFHCEWNEFGQRVLKYYWPKAISYHDITKTDFSIHRGTIDILTGGFPCQPYSQAGKRKGKADDRHLWPEMLRAIQEIQPKWIVAENVLGLVNWNGGLVFDEVQAEMEASGYQVQPFVLPACAVDAPHRRDRVWFVANSLCNGQFGQFERHEVNSNKTQQYAQCFTIKSHSDGVDTNANSIELPKRRVYTSQQEKAERYSCPCDACSHKRNTWDEFPTQPPVCNGNDGFPSKLDGITFSKWRNESIKAGGNAMVPQLIHQIFKAIEQYELLSDRQKSPVH
jgi:DNA (cytosine-5)-methyltransferase 1